MIEMKCVFVKFLSGNSVSAHTFLEDWCMGWWKIEMIVHNSDTHILLSWTWPKHERFFKYHYSNWKFTHTKGDTTLLSKKVHWSKRFTLIIYLYTYYIINSFARNQTSIAININSATAMMNGNPYVKLLVLPTDSLFRGYTHCFMIWLEIL